MPLDAAKGGFYGLNFHYLRPGARVAFLRQLQRYASDDNFDKKKCLEVKKIIKKMVNWKCKKKTIYQKKNLGLRDAIINGIDFFFKNEKQRIILVVCILPSQSFFLFCDNLLNKYKHNKKISLLSC